MQQIVDFILAVDRLKGICRKSRPVGQNRAENSAEHSWQIALLAQVLAPYAVEPVRVERVVGMLLVHDLGEIETGDTIVYAVGGWEERRAAERAAVERLFHLLPKETGAGLLALWEEFDAAETAESRFAHSVDRAMPVLLNLAAQGACWRENDIHYEQVIGRVGPEVATGCPKMWEYLRQRLEEAHKSGILPA